MVRYLRLGFKKITASILGACSLSDRSPWGQPAARRAALCPTERPMWQETEGGVWPAAREEMGYSVQKSMRTWGLPTTSWVSLAVGPPPAGPSDEAKATAASWTATLSEALSQDHQLSHSWLSDSQKL